ncbi:MAG TPA: DUF2846 domain-containing protein [Chthoniobacterales bacterium]|nr:DUF2846 domain-containing protein [Chthoniobacterales bacterium]
MHRLPAPISEETPTRTAAPKTMPAHQTTTAPKSDVPSTDMPKKATESKNGNSTATVFIYRPAGFPWGMLSGCVITIDGVKARTMADPRYSVRKLTPGKHVFEATGGFTHQRVPVEINLQGDQKYYLRMSIDALGFPEGKILFTRVSNAEGVEDIAKLTAAP